MPTSFPRPAETSSHLWVSGKLRWKRIGLSLATASALSVGTASAFPHIAQPGETLASLATRFYGRIQLERVLATANALQGTNRPELTPGRVLEIPAVTYRQVGEGETWKSLAQELLGGEHRYILLAQINGHQPWIQPELGQLIAVPYNLNWVATGEESLATLAYRFLGSTKYAYRLVQYNDLGENGPERGQLLLLPLHELQLTEEGRAAAERASAQISEQSQGEHYQRQRASEQETQGLSEDVRGGRYISAVARGTELLAAGRLSQPGRAQVHLLLLEAYVALDARGLARTSCDAWRSLTTTPTLDPLTTSPKILHLCPATAPVAAPAAPSEDEASHDEDDTKSVHDD